MRTTETHTHEVRNQPPPFEDVNLFDADAALQEALGALNDGAVAAHLMADLGRGARGFAAGVVTGHVAARSGDTRTGIRRAWARFRDVEPFWD